jgi:serine/threonine protein kinase
MSAGSPAADAPDLPDAEAALIGRIGSILLGEGQPADGRLAALLARMIDRMLDRKQLSRRQAATFLGRFLALIPELPSGETLTQDALAARLSDRFVITEMLGAGGRGRVFKALDLLRLEAGEPELHVAVKCAETAEAADIRRLFREWRHAQAVAHPNIVGIHDVARAGVHVFAVQEYVAGRSLRAAIRESPTRPLSPEQTFRIVAQIAEGLARFHACHRIHGDLKPANVICRPDGLVKLIDLSSVMVIPHIEAGRWTGGGDSGGVELTPAYASPQRLSGEDPDPADDIFSFAVTICEMLGQHPFDGQPILDAGALRPSNLPAVLSRQGRRALLRALAPRRQDRWPTVDAFADALRLPG